MSYDLMVFDPAQAPGTRAAVLKWFDSKQAAEEDEAETLPSEYLEAMPLPLQGWYKEMMATFPPLNGPYSDDANIDNPKVTDYGMGHGYIYACFGWDQANEAFNHVIALAEKHRAGVFNVSSDTLDVWIPDKNGKLVDAPA